MFDIFLGNENSTHQSRHVTLALVSEKGLKENPVPDSIFFLYLVFGFIICIYVFIFFIYNIFLLYY